jgi:RimJ/RimL family protein N-acetyltransferase
MADFRLETERLILRSWQDSDRDANWAMAQDEAVMRYLPALDRAGADAMVDRFMAMEAENGHTFWTLERREDGAFLGMCGMAPPRDPLVEYEVGWRLVRHAWGRAMRRTRRGPRSHGPGRTGPCPPSWPSPCPTTAPAGP